MPTIASFCSWLENTSIAMYISGSTWAFPTIETLHVCFLVIVVGTVAIVDLRLLGVASRNLPVSKLSSDILPVTWCAFVGAVITGSLLFSSKATAYWGNIPFRFKIVCLALAGLNMVIFHFLTYRSVRNWDHDPITPKAARIAGALSLLFWICVIGFGRWIGFTVR
jgi:hypothetical protein